MISLAQLRKIDSSLNNITDIELEAIRLSFYEFGQLVFEDWLEQKNDSKSPVGSLTNKPEEHTI